MGFYDGSEQVLSYIEEGVLMEDIELPELPPCPTYEQMLDGTIQYSYPRAIEIYTDKVGKFSIPILTPLADTSEAKDTDAGSTTVRNVSNKNSLNISAYKSSNYIELNIPKYILLNFTKKVPKGTKFILGFLGGTSKVEDARVIGVS